MCRGAKIDRSDSCLRRYNYFHQNDLRPIDARITKSAPHLESARISGITALVYGMHSSRRFGSRGIRRARAGQSSILSSFVMIAKLLSPVDGRK
jgi:hypothetical protein